MSADHLYVGEEGSIMTMLWLLVFAHVTTDFLFSSHELSGVKPDNLLREGLTHGLIAFLHVGCNAHLWVASRPGCRGISHHRSHSFGCLDEPGVCPMVAPPRNSKGARIRYFAH